MLHYILTAKRGKHKSGSRVRIGSTTGISSFATQLERTSRNRHIITEPSSRPYAIPVGQKIDFTVIRHIRARSHEDRHVACNNLQHFGGSASVGIRPLVHRAPNASFEQIAPSINIKLIHIYSQFLRPVKPRHLRA